MNFNFPTGVQFASVALAADDYLMIADHSNSDNVAKITGAGIITFADGYYLNKTNVSAFTPTQDYHPATKKYVDDAISPENLWDRDTTILTPHNIGDSLTLGSASVNAGVISMIQGAVASDPTFSITQATNDVTIAQTVGNMTLSAVGSLILTPNSANADTLSVVADGSDLWLKPSDGALKIQTDEGTNTRTDVAIVGKGTGAAMLTLYDGSNANYWVSLDQTDAIAGMDFGTAVTEFDINDAQRTVDIVIKTKNSATAFVVNSDATAGNEYVGIGLPLQLTNAGVNQIESTATTVNVLDINASSLTSGNALDIYSNSADATGRYLAKIFNDHASATGAVGLYIRNDAPSTTGNCLQIESYATGNTGVASITGDSMVNGHLLKLKSNSADVNARSLLIVHNDHASAVGTACLTIQQDSTGPAIAGTGTLQLDTVGVKNQHDEIGILLDCLTAPKAIVGFTGTGATTTTEAGYESGAGRTWTYSGGLATDKIFQGSTYVYSFDGVDSYLETPDTADMSFTTDIADTAYSAGGWIQVVDNTGGYQFIIGKHSGTTANVCEWHLRLGTDEKLLFVQHDISANKDCSRTINTALSVGWHFIVATYDGTGGATSFADPNCCLYLDGVKVPDGAGAGQSAATNNAGYVCMQGSATLPSIGIDASHNASWAFEGDMGRLFVTGEELTAAQVWKIYEKTRGFYNK
jgi:hypothetical protein